MPVNARFNDIRPAGVALCQTPEDVSYALTWSRENGVPQVPRSGGHSYEGYSTNSGLVISVSAMNSVRHNPDADVIVTGGGAQNRDVAAALTPANRMIPGGQCPTVGVAGLTLGGGLGFSMRLLGVTSDNLTSTQVVLANGDIVTASHSENPDLFWALRGGTGGNFGINTEFTYRASPARDCTVFTVEFSADRTAETLDEFFSMLPGAPRELGLIWYHVPGSSPSERPICGAFGQMYGSASDARDLLAPIINAGGPPLTDEFIEGTYWNAVSYLGPEGDRTHAFLDRSRFLDQRFDGAAIATLTERLLNQPHHGGDTSIFAWGGAISDTAAGDTAFVHRTPVGLIKYSAVWDSADSATQDAATSWLNGTFQTMEPYCSNRSFQNFPDSALEDWPQAYFGENLPRLIDAKHTYDPDRVFDFPQAIPES